VYPYVQVVEMIGDILQLQVGYAGRMASSGRRQIPRVDKWLS
jgi:hypothetical protein